MSSRTSGVVELDQEPDVANRKKRGRPKNTPIPDQHASGFLIRLPEIYRTQLRLLREKERRPFTEEVQIALEEHLAKKGLWPPQEG